MDIAETLTMLGQEIDRELEKCIAELDFSYLDTLKTALCHSLLAPCKRLRPILCLQAGLLCGARRDVLLSLSVIPELLHTYSLIHDDLPCMDDADLRRGLLTLHKKFNEATAVLSGDALLTFAWELLIKRARAFSLSEKNINELVLVLAQAVGINGMLGGQILDMEAEGKNIDLVHLRRIHSLKTGHLFTACLRFAAIIADADIQMRERLESYGVAFGQLFQITDDLLDLTGTAEELGKPVGTDQRHCKATIPLLLGLDGAKKEACYYAQQAKESLTGLNSSEAIFLRELADYTLTRNK